ncbi:DUF2076 family protein [Caldimonas tepidiphila]|uniref:DUF2076 family protein n=1 Tax=Caldimonas tepidiphila TaxID=2315841 RepID=UPI000E5ADFFF|nr:DUF2076 family protein [Caldimonas tepidiphila]
MNAHERLRVVRLVTRLAEQADMPKDPEALRELDALMKVRPDAPYLLMQRALMLELALEQAQLELEQLRQATQALPTHFPAAARPRPLPASPAGGIASRVLGGIAPSWGMGRPVARHGSYGGGGGFLRNAAAVGAGVLGGSLLFQGLENLFDGDEQHHHHYGGDAGQAGLQHDAGFAGDAGFDSGALDEGGGFGLDHDDWV